MRHYLLSAVVLSGCAAPVTITPRTETIHIVVRAEPAGQFAPAPIVMQPAPVVLQPERVQVFAQTNAAPPTVTCSAAMTAPAGSPVMLTAQSNAPGLSYTWSVLMGPHPATYRFASQFDPQDTNAMSGTGPSVPFTTPIVGRYTVQAEGRDGQGNIGRCETQVTMTSHGLRVELSWNTNHTDVDLHAITSTDPRWVSNADCYYANRRPDATQQQPEERQRWLDTDDVDGEGPENIRVDRPELDRDYIFGVHYYSAHSEPDPTTAIVVIYCGDRQVARFEHALVGRRDVQDNDFWRVASVRFDAAGNCAVRPDNRMSRQRDVAASQ